LEEQLEELLALHSGLLPGQPLEPSLARPLRQHLQKPMSKATPEDKVSHALQDKLIFAQTDNILTLC